MAITLNEVTNWLNEQGIKFQTEEENNKLFFTFRGEDFRGVVEIKLIEDGELIQFYIRELLEDSTLKVKSHEYQFQVLQYLLKLNYDEKFGTWEVDLSDGEVQFAVEIPLEDATMTKNQFDRIIKRIISVDDEFKGIRSILETGELPFDASAALNDLFGQLLRSALEAKKSKSDIDDGI